MKRECSYNYGGMYFSDEDDVPFKKIKQPKTQEVTPAALGALARGDMANFLVASTPGGIEAQEKEGQLSLVKASKLPKDMQGQQAKFEKLGIKILGPADEIFNNVELPKGWSVKPTDHSMWSDLLDEKGRKRAGMFYKAAFYDCHAHISLERRYSFNQYHEVGNPKDQVHQAIITDCGKEIAKIGKPMKTEYDRKDYFKEMDKIRDECIQYLKTNFPEYDDPMAYWD